MSSILIVEDDITFGMMLKTWLSKKGFEVSSVSNIARAQKHIERPEGRLNPVRFTLTGSRRNRSSEMDERKRNRYSFDHHDRLCRYPIGSTSDETGARDYVAKPVNPEELLKKMSEALQAKEAPTTHTAAKTSAKKGSSASSGNATEAHHAYLEGESDAAKQLYNYVGLVAPTNMSVLINGSSGTGKEYVAHRIHQLSKRNDKPFIAVDCGSIPKELAASEFFGHVKGSFTGALTDKTGAFVAANGGTIFLDEIGNLSYEVQIQLLRALQERKIRPVGSTQEVSVDIRLVSATNENLEQAIEKGTFREDLFHRINEFTLRMPDLKERKEDILLFANFFLDQANKELDKHLIGFDSKASQALLNYHWPGNLRQMKNIVKRATLLAQGSFITLLELGTELLETSTVCSASMALRNEETEKEHILEALRQTGNNKSKAAQLLNIDRKTLYNKLKLYNIDL